MKILALEQGSEEWHSFKKGKISGTRIGKLCAKSRNADEMYDTTKCNQEYYEIIAERLTEDYEDGMSPAERGIALQEEAIEMLRNEFLIDKTEDMIATDGVWQSDVNSNWICSPDAFSNEEKPKWAVEVKCLSSANHIKAILTGEYPKEYLPQILNYFLVNEDLETLYFTMYDPRFISDKLKLKVFTINRNDVVKEIEVLQRVRSEIEDKMHGIYEKYIDF